MIFEGSVRKSRNVWLIEIPLLDLMTQATSKNEIPVMAKDVVECLCDEADFSVNVQVEGSRLLIESNQPKDLMAMALRRQRARKQLTLAEVATNLGARSINEYAQYEQGKHQPSLEKFEKMLRAIDSSRVPVISYATRSTERTRKKAA